MVDTLYNIINIIYSKYLSKSFKAQKNFFCHFPQKILGNKYISLGKNCFFGKNCIVSAWDKHNELRFTPSIQIGNDCEFGEYNHISAINKIIIGNSLLTGRWVTIRVRFTPISRASCKAHRVLPKRIFAFHKYCEYFDSTVH